MGEIDGFTHRGFTMKAIAPLLLLSACAVDVELDTTEQESTTATFKLLGKPAVAPVDGFEIFADKIIYIGYSAGASRAIETDTSLNNLRSSPQLQSTTAPRV